jgi:hypothetical protein
MKVSAVIKSVILGASLLFASVPATFGTTVDVKPVAVHIVEPTFDTFPSEGVYYVELLIGVDGSVLDAKIPPALSGFESVILKWKFAPAKSEGVPVAVKALLPVKVK